MLKFTKYHKSYNDTLIIEAPDLELRQDIYWLKGENGSGKTTLIKSIAGLIPFDGEISVCGTDIKKERVPYRLIVNYAEAEPTYPVFLTGDDIIRFYVSAKKTTDAQARELCQAFGVNEYSNNKIGTYSSGMAKKLSLVLGFLGNPKLVLLDEPLITLDQRSVGIVEELVKSLYEKGVSFLVTSHQEVTFPGYQSRKLAIDNKKLVFG